MSTRLIAFHRCQLNNIFTIWLRTSGVNAFTFIKSKEVWWNDDGKGMKGG